MRSSRVSLWNLGLACVVGAWLIGTRLSAAPQTAEVQSLLEKARAALGGDGEVSSFRITGSIKSRNRGESGRFAISCDLPSRFVQIENRVFLDPGDTVAQPSYGGAHLNHIIVKMGFDGDEPIYERSPREEPWRLSASRYAPPPLTKAQLQTVLPLAREAFLNLTLGLFASSFSGAPVTFTNVSGPDAGNAVLVKGAGFVRTLVFDAGTGLPERLGDVRYRDYHDVAGRKVPSRIVVGTDEWIIEEFRLR